MNDFPFSPLFEFLEESGFRITLRDYRRLAAALSASGPWPLKRLKSVLMSLLARDQEQRDLFARRFDAFFDEAPETVIPAIDMERALAELRALAQVDMDLKRRLNRRRIDYQEQVSQSQSPPPPRRGMISLLLFLLALSLGTLIWHYYPPPEETAPGPITITKPPVETTAPQFRIYHQQPVIKQWEAVPRRAGEAWKTYWPWALAALLGLLAYRLYLWMVLTIPDDQAPPCDLKKPRHFSLGRVGGTIPPRLSMATLNHLADHLGYFRSKLPDRSLDVPASIQATLDRGGLPTPVFHSRKLVFRVLILEDTFSAACSWNPLARELATGLDQRGVAVEYGEFEGAPRRFYTADGKIRLLDDLEDMRQGYLLLIFSDGRSLRRQEDLFALESIARWPMKAWLALGESRFWGRGLKLAAERGIPVYPADPDGLARAMNVYITERGELCPETIGQAPDTEMTAQITAARLESLLGDAHAWAMDCAMIQPISLPLADALRRKFHAQLPFERLERLLTLPRATLSASGLRFDPTAHSLLRRHFIARRPEDIQPQVLHFIMAHLQAAEPGDKTRTDWLAWKYQYERVHFDLDPATALIPLAALAADDSPLAPYIREEMEHLKTPDNQRPEALPLRVTPDDPRSIHRLKKITGQVNAIVGAQFPLSGLQRGLGALLLFLLLAAAAWTGKAWHLAEEPVALISVVTQGVPARLEKRAGEAWQSQAWISGAGLSETTVSPTGEYRLSWIENAQPVANIIDVSRLDFRAQISGESGLKAPCVQKLSEIGLEIRRCPATKAAQDFTAPSWRERVGAAAPDTIVVSLAIVLGDEPVLDALADLLLQTSSVDVVYRCRPVSADQLELTAILNRIAADWGGWLAQAQVVCLSSQPTATVTQFAQETAVADLIVIGEPNPAAWAESFHALFQPGGDGLIRVEALTAAGLPLAQPTGPSQTLLARLQTAPIQQTFKLKVATKPQTAVIRFTDPSLKYQPDMLLTAGTYPLEISAPGYQTAVKELTISNQDVLLSVILKIQLRSEPLTVSSDEAKKVFNLNENWRPLRYIDNEFIDHKDGTISDLATGLMWQQSGPDNWIYLKDVPAYVEKQNQEQFAGYHDWRLPTVDELLSLMEPEKSKNGLFINSIFDEKQWWCWSADLRSGGGAWLVYFSYGDVGWGAVDDGSYVRLVRRGQ